MKVVLGIAVSAVLLIAAFALPFESMYRLRAGRERAVEEGIEGLESNSFDERERATRRLVSLGEASRPALEEALRSSDAEVRARSATALRALDRKAESREERRLRDYRRIIRVGLGKAGALSPDTNRFTVLSMSPRLAARVAAELAGEFERDVLRHQRCVILMRDLKQPEAAPYLASLFSGGRHLPSTLHHAAASLADFGGRGCLPEVLTGLESPDPFCRRFALRVIAAQGGPEELGAARRGAVDAEPMVRVEAARALAGTGGRRALPDLAALGRDPETEVRVAAIEAITPLPGPLVRETALLHLADPQAKVRAAALELLRRRGLPEDAAAAKALISDSAAPVRGAAIRALATLGDREEAVLLGVRDPSPAVRHAALVVAHGLPEATRREAARLTANERDPYLRGLRRAVLGLSSAN